MKTAKENIALLPESCWGVLLTDKSLIRIIAGESGYRTVNQPHSSMLEDGEKTLTMDEFADQLNAEDGVTKAQRRAMEWGSQFGWETGLADPEKYDERGIPYSDENRKKVIVPEIKSGSYRRRRPRINEKRKE